MLAPQTSPILLRYTLQLELRCQQVDKIVAEVLYMSSSKTALASA